MIHPISVADLLVPSLPLAAETTRSLAIATARVTPPPGAPLKTQTRPALPASRLPARRWFMRGLLVLSLLGLGAAAGCRGRAHDDLYREKLTGEIRILEDQLYEADYENRILADKLEWAQQRLEQFEEPADLDTAPPDGVNPSLPAPAPDSRPDRPPDRPPDRRPDSQPDSRPDLDLELDDIEIDPGTLQPAPGGPEPPGDRDLRVPPIEPGEVVPPAGPGAEPEGPPGQIELNESMNFLGRAKVPENAPQPPTAVRVHPTLSGPYRFDSEDDGDGRDGAEGIMLVLTGADDRGQMVALDDFEIDAEMTVVALDPTREPSQARLARWEFGVDQVQEYVRDQPVSGIHLPLRWQDVLPESDEVIIHVRFRTPVDELASEKEQESAGELVCEGRLNLSDSPSTARWTPRGAATRRE